MLLLTSKFELTPRFKRSYESTIRFIVKTGKRENKMKNEERNAVKRQ